MEDLSAEVNENRIFKSGSGTNAHVIGVFETI